MKEFEVRATGMYGTQPREIFRVVRAENESTVREFFAELFFYNIYIQEVPLTSGFKGLVLSKQKC